MAKVFSQAGTAYEGQISVAGGSETHFGPQIRANTYNHCVINGEPTLSSISQAPQTAKQGVAQQELPADREAKLVTFRITRIDAGYYIHGITKWAKRVCLTPSGAGHQTAVVTVDPNLLRPPIYDHGRHPRPMEAKEMNAILGKSMEPAPMIDTGFDSLTPIAGPSYNAIRLDQGAENGTFLWAKKLGELLRKSPESLRSIQFE